MVRKSKSVNFNKSLPKLLNYLAAITFCCCLFIGVVAALVIKINNAFNTVLFFIWILYGAISAFTLYLASMFTSLQVAQCEFQAAICNSLDELIQIIAKNQSHLNEKITYSEPPCEHTPSEKQAENNLVLMHPIAVIEKKTEAKKTNKGKTATRISIQGTTRIACSLCGTTQPGDQEICLSCEALFQ